MKFTNSDHSHIKIDEIKSDVTKINKCDQIINWIWNEGDQGPISWIIELKFKLHQDNDDNELLNVWIILFFKF